MSNIADKLTNTANVYIGSAKQTVGEYTNNPDLAAAGAAQRVHAETSQKVAEAKLQAEGLAHAAEGNIQKTAGSLTGDYSLQAKGEANIAQGTIERNV